MIIYRHHCPYPDIEQRQAALDQAPIPDGYDAILVRNPTLTAWSRIDGLKEEPNPTEANSRMVQRTATMYATLPLDILNRIDID